MFKFNMTPVDVPKVNTKFRGILTKLPVPESLEIFSQLERYESRSMHGQLPVVWDRAEDFLVFDPYGNCWIDFTSTIFVANAGHSNKKIIEALKRQLDSKLLHSYTFASKIRTKFLKKLIDISPKQLEKAFLLSAGTEATECAIKLIRMYSINQAKSKNIILSFRGSMHGRTMGAEMLKGDLASSEWIGFRDQNMYHLPVPFAASSNNDVDWEKQFTKDIEQLENEGMNVKNIAGFIIESYVGWCAYFYPIAYIQALCKFAKKNNILIAFDDIQAGFGRTGKLFGYQHYDVEPDLVCIGKAISGSMPLSGVIGRKEIMDTPEIGSMSSTHSANSLSCAAGLANLEEIESRNLIKESARKGKILHSFLSNLKSSNNDLIANIFGKGLVAAIIVKNPSTNKPDAELAGKICEKAMQKGLLLVHTGRESIKIGPPLTISDDALLEGLSVLKESISEVARDSMVSGKGTK